MIFFCKKKREWYVRRPTQRNTKKALFVGSTETEQKMFLRTSEIRSYYAYQINSQSIFNRAHTPARPIC